MKVTPFLNKNSRMAKAYGKWFMRAKPYGALDMEDLSNHIAMDSKVERTMVSQITKLLMNGHPIRIPHLGLLKVQVSTEGAETKEAFNAGKHVKNAHLILVPTTEIKEEMRKMKFEKDYDPTKPYDVVTDDDDDGGETPTNNDDGGETPSGESGGFDLGN